MQYNTTYQWLQIGWHCIYINVLVSPAPSVSCATRLKGEFNLEKYMA